MSGSAIKRELNELRVRYQLYPHFRDVIVEGRDDAAFLKWYFAEQSIPNTRVYAIDDVVDVPGSLVESLGHDINARGRVIALAAASESWESKVPSVTCLVDADYAVFEKVPTFEGLLVTDYAAMEVYSLESRPLSKFLAICAKSDKQPSSIISSLKPAWSMIYTLRYLLHRFGNGARINRRYPQKVIDDSGNINLNVRELLHSVTPNLSREEVDRMVVQYREYVARIPDDTLDGIRGHDIAPLLIRYLKFQNELANETYIERLLRFSIEFQDLEDTPLFVKLKQRLLDPP